MGLPPSCSVVYDASGLEVVFAVDLAPGETLRMLLTVTPDSLPGALYLLDSCPEATWPDYDGSGLCGSNEYRSGGWCSVFGCDPLDFEFTHPTELSGAPTTTQRYWLVIDTLGREDNTTWTLEWQID